MPRHRCRLSASSLDYDAKQVTRMVPLHRIGANFDEHYWLPFYGRRADMPTDLISIDDTVSCKPAPCWTVFTLAHVRADGCSSACGLDAADEFVVGNLTQSRFAQAWHSDAVLAERVIPFVDQHCWLPLYSMGAFARGEETLGYRPAAGYQGRIGALREALPCWSAFTEGHVTAGGGKLSACCFDATHNWAIGNLTCQSFTEACSSPSFVELWDTHLRRRSWDRLRALCDRQLSAAQQTEFLDRRARSLENGGERL